MSRSGWPMSARQSATRRFSPPLNPSAVRSAAGAWRFCSRLFRARIEVPSVVVFDLVEQICAPRESPDVFSYSAMTSRMCFARRARCLDGCLRIEVERLRQEPREDAAAPCDIAAVGSVRREDAQQRALSAAVAADEPDAFLLVERDGGAVEQRRPAVADDEALALTMGVELAGADMKGREAIALPLRR